METMTAKDKRFEPGAIWTAHSMRIMLVLPNSTILDEEVCNNPVCLIIDANGMHNEDWCARIGAGTSPAKEFLTVINKETSKYFGNIFSPDPVERKRAWQAFQGMKVDPMP